MLSIHSNIPANTSRLADAIFALAVRLWRWSNIGSTSVAGMVKRITRDDRV